MIELFFFYQFLECFIQYILIIFTCSPTFSSTGTPSLLACPVPFKDLLGLKISLHMQSVAGEWLIYHGLHFSFSLQLITANKSNLGWDSVLSSCLCVRIWSGLACTGFMHDTKISMSPYVYLPYCVQTIIFLDNRPPLRFLYLFHFLI